MEQVTMQPIGQVANGRTEPVDEGWGDVVQGLDAIDGTPVLDIKPYFPAFDRRDDATVPEWVDRLMTGYFN